MSLAEDVTHPPLSAINQIVICTIGHILSRVIPHVSHIKQTKANVHLISNVATFRISRLFGAIRTYY